MSSPSPAETKRPDGSFPEPTGPFSKPQGVGRWWCRRQDGGLAQCDIRERDGKLVYHNGIPIETDRFHAYEGDRWYRCYVPGLDPPVAGRGDEDWFKRAAEKGRCEVERHQPGCIFERCINETHDALDRLGCAKGGYASERAEREIKRLRSALSASEAALSAAERRAEEAEKQRDEWWKAERDRVEEELNGHCQSAGVPYITPVTERVKRCAEWVVKLRNQANEAINRANAAEVDGRSKDGAIERQSLEIDDLRAELAALRGSAAPPRLPPLPDGVTLDEMRSVLESWLGGRHQNPPSMIYKSVRYALDVIAASPASPAVEPERKEEGDEDEEVDALIERFGELAHKRTGSAARVLATLGGIFYAFERYGRTEPSAASASSGKGEGQTRRDPNDEPYGCPVQ